MKINNIIGVCVLASAMLMPWKASAVEGASGFYLLGGKGSLAGVMAPAGNYFSVDSYVYSADISKSKPIPVAGELEFGLDVDVFVALPTVLQVTDNTFLNGRIAYGLVLPIVHKDISFD